MQGRVLHKVKNWRRYLFVNVQTGQTIVKNTFWLALAEGCSRLLKLGLIIFVARVLGAMEYGKFTFALAFVGLFVVVADFGLGQILTREFAQDRTRERALSSILSLKIFLSLLALALMIGLSFFITTDPLIRKVIWLLALMVVFHSGAELLFAFLRARQKMEYEALIRIGEALLVTGLGFAVLLASPSLLNLTLTYLLAALLAFLGAVLFFHQRILALELRFEKRVWQNFLRLSWPLALVGFFSVIYNQIDSVMMGFWGMMQETGWYNAAYKVVFAALIPGFLITQSFFPALNAAFSESKDRFQRLGNNFFQIIVLLALPLVTGGIILAPRLIIFVYDTTFFPSTFALQILLVMAGLIYLNYVFSKILIIANLQGKIFAVTFAAALLNIILNLMLIPRYSLYGAALATVATFLLIFFSFLGLTLRYTSFRPFSRGSLLVVLAALAATGLMALVISQPGLARLHLIPLVFAGALVYLASFLLAKKGLTAIFPSAKIGM